MAKIVILEKFKGELNGKFAAIYVATDVNMDRYMTEDLKLKQVGDDIVNDVKGTKWSKMNDALYSKVRRELSCVASHNYLAVERKEKHVTPGKEDPKRKDRGISM